MILDRIAEGSEKRPKIVIVVILMVTMVLGMGMLRIEKESDLMAFLPEDKESVEVTLESMSLFGGQNYEVILVKGDVTSPEGIQEISELEQDIRSIPGFALGVESFIDYLRAQNVPDSMIPMTVQSPEAQQMLSNMLTPDRSAALIRVRVNPQFEGDIQEYINRVNEERNLDTAYTGTLTQAHDMLDTINRDNMVLLPAAVILVCVVLFLTYRRFSDIVLPFLVIGISVVWVLGIMGYSGITFSNIFVAIMPLIYGVSVAYSVHLLTRYYEERAKGSISSRSAVIGIKTVGMAILLTVITTSFGFGSFTISDLPPLQEFGIVLVLGIIFSFLLVITLMPSLLVLRDEGTPAGEKRQSRTNKLLDRISLVALHHKKYVLLLTGITVAACVAVAPTIPTSIDYDELLPQESITISTEQEVAELFGGGSESVIIMVEGDILSEYESLLMIEERIRALPLTNKDGTPVVTGVVSFADMLYRVQGNLQAACADQQAAAILSQTLVLDDSHANYLTKGLILVFVDAESDAEARNLTREIRGIIENHPTLSLKLGGAPVLMADILDGMQSTQIKTTALALVLSLIVVILLFRSVPLGIMTVLPVILTIAWEFGVLKVTGWNLDIFTIMVSALIIGIGIDFSIHVVHRFREEFEKTMVAETAVENTVLNVGKALISTTATTGGAFLVLALSSMPIITRFGLLVAIVIGLSFLSALLVLPSILVYYFERKK